MFSQSFPHQDRSVAKALGLQAARGTWTGTWQNSKRPDGTRTECTEGTRLYFWQIKKRVRQVSLVFSDISTCHFCQFWQHVSWLHGLWLRRRKTRCIASKAEHWSLSRCGDCVEIAWNRWKTRKTPMVPTFWSDGPRVDHDHGGPIQGFLETVYARLLGFDTRIPWYSFIAACIRSSHVIRWSYVITLSLYIRLNISFLHSHVLSSYSFYI